MLIGPIGNYAGKQSKEKFLARLKFTMIFKDFFSAFQKYFNVARISKKTTKSLNVKSNSHRCQNLAN